MKKTIFVVCILLAVILSCNGGHDNPAPVPQPQPAQPVSGSAYLYWDPCTTYTDGSPVSLGGYKVYHGTAHNTYTDVAAIPLGNLVSILTPTYTANGLSAGTHYFAVTAFDAAGTESALSQEVHKMI